MRWPLSSLMALFDSLKKPGKSVTFILSTKGDEVTAKLGVKLINANSLLSWFTLLTRPEAKKRLPCASLMDTPDMTTRAPAVLEITLL